MPTTLAFPCRVEPSGESFAAAPDEALLDAALGQGVDLPHGCRVGTCGACAVEVTEGAENLEPPDAIEAHALERFRMSGAQRLACRARVHGPVALQPLE